MNQMVQQTVETKLKLRAAFVSFLAAFLLFAFPVFAEVDLGAEFETESNSWENWPVGPELWGDTACLMDADTGTVLFSKGADAQRFPASITKVMTAMVVLDNCNLDEIVTMTETGLADAYAESSNVNPSLGEQFTVEQCLEMLLVKSANDIASQLAEYTCGSVEAFAEKMNEKAAQLGCTNTHFTNASGLEDDNHYTSAYDMCLIMSEAMRYDRIREIMNMPVIEIPPTEYSDARYYEGHVYLMQPDNAYYYENCIGGKTGYTEISESTLVCAALKDGMLLVGAVLGAPDTGTNAEDMVNLFNYGYDHFAGVDLASLGKSEEETQTEGETEMSVEEMQTNTDNTDITKTTPSVTPSAVTTSEPKADITKTPGKDKSGQPVRSIIYIVIIVILGVAIIALIFIQIRVTKIRNQNRKRKR